MKKLYSLLSTVFVGFVAYAQVTIYSENVGTPSANTAVGIYTGWQNATPITYSSTGATDVRNTTNSTGYTGASGGGNVWFATTGNPDLLISGINTSSYENLVLSFGFIKTTSAATTELGVQVSADGTTWTNLTYAVSSGTGTSNIWSLKTASGTIPSATNLRIKFTKATTTSGFRIDDIKLVGTLKTLSVNDVIASKNITLKNTVVDNALSFQTKGNATVKVYNMNGQLVKSSVISVSNSTVDVASLPKGNYVVTSELNGEKVSQKIIKK